MEELFKSVIKTEITIGSFFIILLFSFILGFILSIISSVKSNHTKSFLMSIVMIPSVVAIIIIMVNGNLGTGVAIAGAFGLVRFRSSPGTAREISSIFIATATGLILGMGYISYAVLFVIIVSVVFTSLNISKFGEKKQNMKILKITIPEDLNYNEAFEDVLHFYTNSFVLISVKTVNLGSMYKVKYKVNIIKDVNEKEFIDEIRCLNGNLEVMLYIDELNSNEL